MSLSIATTWSQAIVSVIGVLNIVLKPYINLLTQGRLPFIFVNTRLLRFDQDLSIQKLLELRHVVHRSLQKSLMLTADMINIPHNDIEPLGRKHDFFPDLHAKLCF